MQEPSHKVSQVAQIVLTQLLLKYLEDSGQTGKNFRRGMVLLVKRALSEPLRGSSEMDFKQDRIFQPVYNRAVSDSHSSQKSVFWNESQGYPSSIQRTNVMLQEFHSIIDQRERTANQKLTQALSKIAKDIERLDTQFNLIKLNVSSSINSNVQSMSVSNVQSVEQEVQVNRSQDIDKLSNKCLELMNMRICNLQEKVGKLQKKIGLEGSLQEKYQSIFLEIPKTHQVQLLSPKLDQLWKTGRIKSQNEVVKEGRTNNRVYDLTRKKLKPIETRRNFYEGKQNIEACPSSTDRKSVNFIE